VSYAQSASDDKRPRFAAIFVSAVLHLVVFSVFVLQADGYVKIRDPLPNVPVEVVLVSLEDAYPIKTAPAAERPRERKKFIDKIPVEVEEDQLKDDKPPEAIVPVRNDIDAIDGFLKIDGYKFIEAAKALVSSSAPGGRKIELAVTFNAQGAVTRCTYLGGKPDAETTSVCDIVQTLEFELDGSYEKREDMEVKLLVKWDHSSFVIDDEVRSISFDGKGIVIGVSPSLAPAE
jgi:hypothetical protein